MDSQEAWTWVRPPTALLEYINSGWGTPAPDHPYKITICLDTFFAENAGYMGHWVTNSSSKGARTVCGETTTIFCGFLFKNKTNSIPTEEEKLFLFLFFPPLTSFGQNIHCFKNTLFCICDGSQQTQRENENKGKHSKHCTMRHSINATSGWTKCSEKEIWNFQGTDLAADLSYAFQTENQGCFCLHCRIKQCVFLESW